MSKKRVTQNDIIKYLATYPTATHGEIMKKLDDDRGNLTRKLQKLEKNKIIQKMGELKHPQEPGSYWGLTDKGYGNYIILTNYSQDKMRSMFHAYQTYSETAGRYMVLLNILEEELGKNNEFMGTFILNLALLMSNERPQEEIYDMMNGLFRGNVSKQVMKKIQDGLEAYTNRPKLNFVSEPFSGFH